MSTTPPTDVIIGVDTHKDVHAAVAISALGVQLSATTISASSKGYQALETWATSLGTIRAIGIEGTRSDFAHRALTHFVTNVLPSGAGNCERHRDLVEQALGNLQAPQHATRPRASDAEILSWLGRPAQAGGGIGQLLRRIREEGIACEQSRFSRLCLQARQRRSEGAMCQ